MTLTAFIELKPSFKKKVNHSAVQKAMQNTIRKTTLKAENGCKKECPVRTGKLMRSHSNHIGANEGQVRNSAGYAVYVVHGTRRQKANNYPLRVMQNISSQQFAGKTFMQELKNQGVLG